MKAQSITTLFIAAVLVVACGQQPEGVDAKKARLTEAKSEMVALKAEIATLEREIAQEDPDFLKSSETAVMVTSLAANKAEFQHKIEVRGSVMSRTNINISSEVMGQLKAVNVKEGQRVRKDQVIAVVDSESLEKQIDEVQTQLGFATTVFEKRDRLWKKNIGTEIDYLQAKNNKEALERQLETLNTQLAKMEIKAPQSGTIEAVPAKTGEIVQPGAPLAFLVSNADMYITAEVSESFIGKFNVGDAVSASIPSLGESFETRISSIGKVINPESRTFTVEVRLPRVESYMKANLVTILNLTDYKVDEAVVIPSRIIQEDKQGNFVYLIDNNKAKKVHIQLGQSYDNHTQVVAGLSGGETIIDKGNRSVADGSAVSIQN